MKVFRFTTKDCQYGIQAKTEQEAKDHFEELCGDGILKTEEISEDEWDEKFITIHDDNDSEKESWKTSIREEMIGEHPQLIYSNNECMYS